MEHDAAGSTACRGALEFPRRAGRSCPRRNRTGNRMSELRFDGRVAIVTGAGGRPSLGRAYARLLASRGARVVVNDIGASPNGKGRSDNAAAELVVKEILDEGGEAVADTHNVA